jgi:hypothetical protein
MKRIALFVLPVVLLGAAGVVLLLLLRRRRSGRAEERFEAIGAQHAEPPAPTAGVDVLTGPDMKREEDEEFKHGALQHLEEERLGVKLV